MSKKEFSNNEFFTYQGIGKEDKYSAAELKAIADKNENSKIINAGGVVMYGLSKGKSFDDLLDMTPAEKSRLGNEFLSFLGDNPPTEMDNNIVMERYGAMLDRASHMLLNEKLPYYKAEDMRKTPEESKERFNTIRDLSHDLNEVIGMFSESGAFSKGFGGAARADQAREKCRIAEGYVNFMQAEMDCSDYKNFNGAGGEYAPRREELNVKESEGVPVIKAEASDKDKAAAAAKLGYGAAQAERFIGGKYLRAFGKYNEDLKVNSFSLAARKSGLDSFKIEALENEVYKKTLKSALEGEITAQYAVQLNHDREFTKSFVNNSEAEANTKRAEAYEKHKTDYDSFVAYEKERLAETKERFSLGDNVIKKFFPNYLPEMSAPEGVSEEVKNRFTPEQREFYEQLQRIEPFTKHDGVGREDEVMSKIKGLATFASLIAMNNKEILFTDMPKESHAADKLEAGRLVMEAYADIEEHPELMGKLVARAAYAYARISPKDEIMNALGKRNLLEYGKTNEASAELKRGQNRMEIFGAMSALSEMCTNSDYIINSAVKGRDVWLPFTADTGKEDTAAAKKVYDSAREQMELHEKKNYQNAAFNKYQQEMLLDTFNSCEKQIMTGEVSFAESFAAADKALDIIGKDQRVPLCNLPGRYASEIDAVQTAARHSDILSKYNSGNAAEAGNAQTNNSRDILFRGISKKDTREIDKKVESMDIAPKKPEKLSRWVLFWNKRGFYKDTVREHQKASANYERYMKEENERKAAGSRAVLAKNLADDIMEDREKGAKVLPQVQTTLKDLMKKGITGKTAAKAAEHRTPAVTHAAPEINPPERGPMGR